MMRIWRWPPVLAALLTLATYLPISAQSEVPTKRDFLQLICTPQDLEGDVCHASPQIAEGGLCDFGIYHVETVLLQKGTYYLADVASSTCNSTGVSYLEGVVFANKDKGGKLRFFTFVERMNFRDKLCASIRISSGYDNIYCLYDLTGAGKTLQSLYKFDLSGYPPKESHY